MNTHGKVRFRNFSEIALRHGCSPVNLLHIFRIPFPKNTSEGLLPLIKTKVSEEGPIWAENNNNNNKKIQKKKEKSINKTFISKSWKPSNVNF